MRPCAVDKSLDVVRVQAVEGAKIGKIERAALGGLRIHVGQVVEVRRQGRLAVHCNRARRRSDDALRLRRTHREGEPKRGAEQAANRMADHGRRSIIGGRRIPNGRRIFDPTRPRRRFFARGAWWKGRNCYWNIASNMERGAPIRSAFPAPRVVRSPGSWPTPIVGADWRFSGARRSAVRFRLTVRKDN